MCDCTVKARSLTESLWISIDRLIDAIKETGNAVYLAALRLKPTICHCAARFPSLNELTIAQK